MIGVGIDLLEIGRMEDALARRPRLAERIFTSEERAYAERHKRPAQHFAARFCAKESVAKALNLRAWAFREIEVVATGAAPRIRLTGRAAEAADALGAQIHISLTHSDLTAGAVAVASATGAR
ncbi:MAG: holo-ACP synthase [Solirubrobacteraceae bacterium]|nr:holo-ACP synthase [Solirubrobacteraceae bacterium]